MRFLILSVLISGLAFSASEYEGTWTSPCIKDQEIYTKDVWKATGSELTHEMSIYGDAECSTKYVEVLLKGTLDIGVPSQAVAMSRETQMIFSLVTLTPQHEIVTGVLNGNKICGLENWQTGVAKNVAGANCENQQMPKIGDSVYNLISLQNNVLYLGKLTEQLNGTSPEKRPRELDKQKPFSKK